MLAIGGALLGAELTIRVSDYLRAQGQTERTAWYWLYVRDPMLGYRGRPNVRMRTRDEVIQHDRDGFRDDRSFNQIPSDRRLVICVGESSTYGLKAGSSATTYPARLEFHLRAFTGDRRWVVFNAGMPGYTTQEVVALVGLRLLKVRPEFIVAMDLHNDYVFVAKYLRDELDYDFYPLRLARSPATLTNEMFMHSSLYGLAATRLLPYLYDDLGTRQPDPVIDPPTPRGLRQYSDNLAMLALICRRHHVRLLIVDQPVNPHRLAREDAVGLDRFRSQLASFAAESQVQLLSANSTMDWGSLEMTDAVHLGPKGYDFLARTLAQQMVMLAPPEAASSASDSSGR